MSPQAATLMAQYNRWMNQRMYNLAGTLPDEAITQDRGAFFGSILSTLNHIAVSDTIWLHRFAQHADFSALRHELVRFPRPASLRQEMASSLSGLGAYRQAVDSVIESWAAALTHAQLSSTLSYENMAGQAASKNVGALVLHFFNHQTHHRGQVSTLLHQAGCDVGVTDLLAVIPNEAS